MRTFNPNRRYDNNALSMDELQRMAPSAFAGQAYHDRSSRYTFIPTSDVISGMQQAGFVPVSAQQGRSRIAGKELFTKHMIRFRAQNQALNVVGDSLLEAILINSHDGTSRYKMMGGVFRLACLNGLVIAESMFASVSVRHTGNVIQEVVEGAQNLFDNAPQVMHAIREWQGLMLAPAEQLLLADAARTIRFADNEGNVDSPVTPEMLLAARRADDTGNDLWHTFNRVQENATKGFRTGLRDNEGRRIGAVGIKSIDGDVKLNKALWTLAEGMAKIKNQ